MAKLTDLPAELISRIVRHVFDANQAAKRRDDHTPPGDHHLLDHTEINCAAEPKPRPHLERLASPVRHVYIQYRPRPQSHLEFSWPDGLPKNPLLPLSLISRTFCHCAQELLFQNVALGSIWTASLFLESLTCSTPHEDSSPQRRPQIDYQAEQHELRRPSPLAQHVRSLQFAWGGPCSMGKGGVSILCEILRSCPLLENIAICNTFRLACKEPILEALASKPHIKEFVILNNAHGENSTFQWQAYDVVSRLFPHWNSLETVDFFELGDSSTGFLKAAANPLPSLNCATRTLILTDHELDELALSALLKSSAPSLRTLEIIGPGYKLDRAALCRVLQGCTSPILESLTLESSHCERPLSSDLNSDDPLTSPGLLDIVFSSPKALRNLKTLSFIGPVATGRLFKRLPKSIVKLAWESCHLPADALVETLSSSGNDAHSLPNLKCCSVRSRYGWSPADELAVRAALRIRGACFHISLDRMYGSPTLTDAIEEEELGDEEDVREMDHWLPPAVTINRDWEWRDRR
ncbi:hypothetical protein PCANC_00524 [Puccinia coronata f. sp. avenae]|uniref:Uncharacterized protein n=1 Tax=Puccinia coronata f. sp. avenae TaxID=200324 RepID=A0A2N5W858_9BASI|nr:hypothetical protein PCANC_00524 [Puccinia coronata f. sp. avenae]